MMVILFPVLVVFLQGSCMHRSEFGHHSVHSLWINLTLDYGSADCPLVGCFWNTVASHFGMWPLFFSFIRVHLRMVLIETLIKQVLWNLWKIICYCTASQFLDDFELECCFHLGQCVVSKYYIKLAGKEMCDLPWSIECLSILTLICTRNFVKVVKLVVWCCKFRSYFICWIFVHECNSLGCLVIYSVQRFGFFHTWVIRVTLLQRALPFKFG